MSSRIQSFSRWALHNLLPEYLNFYRRWEIISEGEKISLIQNVNRYIGSFLGLLQNEKYFSENVLKDLTHRRKSCIWKCWQQPTFISRHLSKWPTCQGSYTVFINGRLGQVIFNPWSYANLSVYVARWKFSGWPQSLLIDNVRFSTLLWLSGSDNSKFLARHAFHCIMTVSAFQAKITERFNWTVSCHGCWVLKKIITWKSTCGRTFF